MGEPVVGTDSGAARVDRLRAGDIVLLAPPAGPVPPGEPPVPTTVTKLDGSRYSHAVMLEAPGSPWWALSANQEKRELGLFDGVNRIPLTSFAARPMVAVRPWRNEADVPAVLEHAQQFVETATYDPADFSWEQIFLSAIATAIRHLDYGDGRERLWSATHAVSRKLKRAEWNVPRFDCCEFVVAMYEEQGHRLDIRERDPLQRDPWMAAKVLGDWARFLVDHFGEAIDPEESSEVVERHELEDAFPGDDDALLDHLHWMLAVLRRIWPMTREELFGTPGPALGDQVHRPFMSPRLMLASLTQVAEIPVGVLV